MIALERSESSAINAGRGYYKQFRDDRAEVGTGVHETVEAEHTGSWNFPTLDEEQARIMQQWVLFNEVYEVRPLYSEATVWNHTHNYAGTLDGIWEVNGPGTDGWETLIIDLKTSKNTYNGHWMQGAALRHAEKLMVKGPERPGAVYYKSNQKEYTPGWWTEEAIPETTGLRLCIFGRTSGVSTEKTSTRTCGGPNSSATVRFTIFGSGTRPGRRRRQVEEQQEANRRSGRRSAGSGGPGGHPAGG
jgi:hypothetical protein